MQNETALFEQTILPHLDAAYNLARWLVGNEPDARDLVQDACLRAFKSFPRYRGGDARSWLLTIVRNAAYTALRKRGASEQFVDSDKLESLPDDAPNPDELRERAAKVETVRAAIARLPGEFKEVIVLREMEGFSYKEIADVVGVPIGTVMSRLARGRRGLQKLLVEGSAP
ncbi:MAG: sigma-70 family RNA polymerase sigma factor [Verrucomicrobiota bacterium]